MTSHFENNARNSRAATFLALAGALTALAVSAAAPASAEAGWVIKGRGFGHGVGMSQYGAYGQAREGRNYKRILRHFYKGTKIGNVESRRVRVLLTSGPSVGFSKARRACGKDLKPSRSYRFARAGARVALTKANGRRITRCGRSGKAGGGGSIAVSGKGEYRGQLVAVVAGSGVNGINRVAIDHYARGVVPNEMPASWPAHALRAQAVAARSYALTRGSAGTGFDLYDDTRSQVYNGRSSEAAPTNRAVKATAGEVVKAGSEIASTYYFSTSGGLTEAVEFGFGGGGEPSSYLKSVRDPEDKLSPYHRWRVKMTRREVESRLGSLVKGRFKGIRVKKTGASPRILRARVLGTQGKSTATGAILQSRLGLRSTWFRVKKD